MFSCGYPFLVSEMLFRVRWKRMLLLTRAVVVVLPRVPLHQLENSSSTF